MPRFTDLPTAVLRLVMHCLDSAQLLRLATCCRATLRAAQSDFAWRHSALRVASNTQGHSKLLRGSLVRHAPIHLSLVLSQKFLMHQSGQAMEAFVLRTLRPYASRLHGFDAALSRYIPLLSWQTILADESLAGLRVLRLGSAEIAAQCTEQMLESICLGMPRLTELDLRVFEPLSDIWTPLGEAHALRTLSIIATDAIHSDRPCVLPLAPNVTRLNLTGLLHLQSLFSQLLASPVLDRIVELTLGDLPSEVAMGFQGLWGKLQQCRTVHLLRVYNIDRGIACAHQAPMLRALRITPADDFASETVPSPESLGDLLRVSSALIVSLVIPPLADSPLSATTRTRRFDGVKESFPRRLIFALASEPHLS